MSDLPLTPDQEDSALAAEYVLGLLDLPERLAVDRRLKNDAALNALVRAWEDHFAALNIGFAEAPAPDHLARIEARLFPQPPARSRRWTGWLSGLAFAAVVGVAVLALRPAPMEEVAMLATEDQSIIYHVQHQGPMLMVSRMAGSAAPAGQVHELWIIPAGGVPVSVGLLTGDKIELPAPEMGAGATLAVSMEPEGGSPTGQPTGPVLMAQVIDA